MTDHIGYKQSLERSIAEIVEILLRHEEFSDNQYSEIDLTSRISI